MKKSEKRKMAFLDICFFLFLLVVHCVIIGAVFILITKCIGLILFIPGLIAFLGGGLKNGANV